MQSEWRNVEAATLKTFQNHRPSEYFSHLSDEGAFVDHLARVEDLYRFGLCLPPEFFDGKTVIDLGSGTGENSISLAVWGASCTLVDLNPEAIERAELVFDQRAPVGNRHRFIASSLFDLAECDLNESFDVAHSRGVFTHVKDKARAFRILASYARPGGYVIYGDRNVCGGVQEMLQRLCIYSIAKNTDEMIEVAETLFWEDIDASQAAVPRTREAIIFDRWVIQQQDDPSISEVLNMMSAEGIEYVSSWPKIEFSGRGTSTYTPPSNLNALVSGSALTESLWMLMRGGEEDAQNCGVDSDQLMSYAAQLHETAGLLRNLQTSSNVDQAQLRNSFVQLSERTLQVWDARPAWATKAEEFYKEVDHLLLALSNGESATDLRALIDSFDWLFKGRVGVRHVDYVGFKPASSP